MVKPYIGGGFGNKQEVLYEPLNAWLCAQVGGRPVRLEVSREETFQNTRSRHPISFDVRAAVDGDGYLMARECVAVSNQGGYASHGHAIVSNAVTGFRQTYLDQLAHRSDAWTVYTNIATPGAMRGYGIPQANFALECMMEDIALQYGLDPLEFRVQNLMPQGYVDPLNGIVCHSTGARECVEKGRRFIRWDELREKYQNQTGPVRRGVGMAVFSYKTGVWPISLETSSARVVLNQDGTVQLQLGATEIGQGGDTVFSQMAAQAIGIPTEDVHIVSTQDTDTAPFDTGAYASRQTYVTGHAIKKAGLQFRDKVLDYARELLPGGEKLDIQGRNVVDGASGEVLLPLAELALTAFYSFGHSEHLTGLGYALSEEMKYDPKTGRLLNGNLLDYKMPTALDHPELHALFVETEDPSGPFGNKALGEPPAIPVAPAVRNALLHATGVAVNTLPLSPQRLVEAFREGGLLE